MAQIINCPCFHTKTGMNPKLPEEFTSFWEDCHTEHSPTVVRIMKLVQTTRDGQASSNAWDSLTISVQHNCCTNIPID